MSNITWNGQPYRPLAVQYPTRVHPGVKLFTTGFFLNTRQPPFNNLKARQAVNYAIDRARIIQLLHFGSPGQAAPTCQILPPGFPGYQRYCPYTVGTKDGFWNGPDLSKAVRLAKESGTTDVPVTLWDDSGKPVGTYVVQLLRRLGYRATLREVSYNRLNVLASNSHKKLQMGSWYWAADFPTAPDEFLPVLTCRSFYENPANTLNSAGYCNPRVNQLAKEAQAVQPTDPAVARKLWARVNRIVTNQAPWVPVFNPSPTVFVSARVGNYQESPYYASLLDQIWVR